MMAPIGHLPMRMAHNEFTARRNKSATKVLLAEVDNIEIEYHLL